MVREYCGVMLLRWDVYDMAIALFRYWGCGSLLTPSFFFFFRLVTSRTMMTMRPLTVVGTLTAIEIFSIIINVEEFQALWMKCELWALIHWGLGYLQVYVGRCLPKRFCGRAGTTNSPALGLRWYCLTDPLYLRSPEVQGSVEFMPFLLLWLSPPCYLSMKRATSMEIIHNKIRIRSRAM